MAELLVNGANILSDLISGGTSTKNITKAAEKAVSNLGPQVSERIANTITDTANERLQTVGQQFTQETVNVKTDTTIFILYNIRNIFTVILIVWSVILLVKQYTTLLSDEMKDNVNYINTILFGTSGMLPLLFLLWMGVLLSITLLPVLSDVSGFIIKLNKVIAVLLGSNI